MSEAADTPELSGLARSIDALFTRAGAEPPGVAAPEPMASVAEEAAETFPHEPVEVLTDEPALSFDDEPSDGDAPDVEDTSYSDAAGSPEPPPVPSAAEPAADPAEFVLAVEALLAGEPGSAERVEGLADGLRDRLALDPLVDAAERIAREAGDPPDEDLVDRALAIMNPAVASRLVQRIGRERDEGRRAAYATVCRSLGPIMARALRGALTDTTDRAARGTYHEMLIAMGEASRPVIEEMVEDENGLLVSSAVSILGETGGERAVELVTSALANPDARARRAALVSLAKLGDEEAGTLVVGFLEDPDPEVRLAAATAAGELRVDRALRPLLAMLDAERDPDRVVLLIRALGLLGDPGAVPAIEKHAVKSMFSKPSAEVRVEAYRALQRIGTPHARELVSQALSDKEVGVRAAVRRIVESPS